MRGVTSVAAASGRMHLRPAWFVLGLPEPLGSKVADSSHPAGALRSARVSGGYAVQLTPSRLVFRVDGRAADGYSAYVFTCKRSVEWR